MYIAINYTNILQDLSLSLSSLSDLWRGVYSRFGHTVSLERRKKKGERRRLVCSGRKSDFLARRGCWW